MKLLIGSLCMVAALAVAQPTPEAASSRASQTTPSRRELSEPEQNYQITIELKEGKEKATELRVVSMAGKFKVQTVARQKVKIDDNEIPVTLTVDGTLEPLDGERCRLMLFVGRTLPYVTGSTEGPGGRRSQFQQQQLGFNTTVVLTSGKPLVVQSDDLQQLTLSMKRL